MSTNIAPRCARRCRRCCAHERAQWRRTLESDVARRTTATSQARTNRPRCCGRATSGRSTVRPGPSHAAHRREPDGAWAAGSATGPVLRQRAVLARVRALGRQHRRGRYQPADAAMRTRNLANVTAHVSNLCEWQAPEAVVLEGAVVRRDPVLPEAEIVVLLRRIRQWMRPGGMLFIGGVPIGTSSGTTSTRPSARRLLRRHRARPANHRLVARARLAGAAVPRGRLRRRTARSPQDPRLIYADFRFNLSART